MKIKKGLVKNFKLNFNSISKENSRFFYIFGIKNSLNKIKQFIFILTIIFLYDNNYKLM